MSRKLLVTLLWLLAGAQFVNMARHPFIVVPIHAAHVAPQLPNHWDFRVYRAAAEMTARGEDPLDLQKLSTFGTDLPFNYSPAYARFNAVLVGGGDAHIAEIRFLTLKLASILLGVGLIIRGLRLNSLQAATTAFVVAFGFSSALLVDVAAGNITSFEFPLAIVVLLASLRRNDFGLFLAVAALSLGKPTWGVFALVPLLLHADRRALQSFAIGAAGFVLPLVASILLDAEGTRTYLAASFAWRESGWINPCLREIISELHRLPLGGGRHPGPRSLLGLWILASLGTGIWAMRTRWLLSGRAGLAFGSACILLLPIILPRFKPYSFALLIPFFLYTLFNSGLPVARYRWAIFAATAPFLFFMDGTFIHAVTYFPGVFLKGISYFPIYFTMAAFMALVGCTRTRPEPLGLPDGT